MSTLQLTLMNHHFEVPCEAEERQDLAAAAKLLEAKLDQVTHLRGEHKILMVALNICYDLLSLKKDSLLYANHLEKQLEDLIQTINQQAAENSAEISESAKA